MRTFLLILFTYFISNPLIADKCISRYTVNEGLSQNSVTSIIQDSSNLLWISTFDGLNRFDGEHFKTYRHDPHDPASLSNNRIITLAVDEEGVLWSLHANRTISKYCSLEDRFYHIPIHGKRQVNDFGNEVKRMLVFDGSAVITGATRTFVVRVDSTNPVTTRVKALKRIIAEHNQQNNKVLSVCVDDEDDIWLSTEKGVGVIVLNSGVPYFEFKSEITFHSIQKNREGGLIFLCDNGFYDIDKESIQQIKEGLLSFSSLDHLKYRTRVTPISISKNNIGEYYVASNRGVFTVNSNKQITYLVENETVRASYVDNFNVVWCGGIRGMISINPHRFTITNVRFAEESFAMSNHVRSIKKDIVSNHVWISSTKGGVRSYKNVGYNQWQEQLALRKGQTVHDFQPLSDGAFLLSSVQGVLFYKSKEDLEKDHYQRICGARKKFFYYKFLQDQEEKIWIAANRLYCFKNKNGSFQLDTLQKVNQSLPNNQIMCMAKSPDQRYLWLGYRGEGVYRLDVNTGEIKTASSLFKGKLRSSYVWSLFYNQKGELCVGTDAGLNIVTDSNYVVNYVSELEGVPSDKIEAIQEDRLGNLWLATSQGIICYNPIRKKYQIFDYSDGFQSNTFVAASCIIQDSIMCFGGENGVSFFQPAILSEQEIGSNAIVSSLYVNNKKIKLESRHRYEFDDHQNNLSFNFLNYYSPYAKKIGYEYRLVGVQQEWKRFYGNNLTFHKLPPGEYKLQVRVLSHSDIVDIPMFESQFFIHPPTWKHPIALIAYLVLIILIIHFLIKEHVYRTILKNRLLLESELREKDKRDADEKLQFYTNVAHEIRTPLTLIKGPISDLIVSDTLGEREHKTASLVLNNVNILSDLTEQILDFKKAVAGQLKLELHKNDIVPIIRQTIENFQHLASKKQINLKYEEKVNYLDVYFDNNKLIQILNNLLSNAIKFTKSKGEIIVVFNVVDNIIQLEVHDNGVGIKGEDIPFIFDRFYKNNQSGGSGIGLAFTKTIVDLFDGTIDVTSDVNIGTSFMIKIPVPHNKSLLDTQVRSTAISDNADEYKAKLLVVEDNISLNNYLCQLLDDNYLVFQAFDGNQAIEMTRENNFDLIISDVMMPELDGFEFVNRIKKSKKNSHVPVLFITAKSDIEDQIKGFDSGAIDYIIKPFNSTVLRKKVNNILSQCYSGKNYFKKNMVKAPEITLLENDKLFIQKARVIVERNISEENFGVQSLSDEMGISRVHLLREFNRIMSLSPSDFIRSMKMNHAKHLISSGNYSIKEVVWEVGMKSHSGFTKAYKEEFGYCPSEEMIKSNNETHE